VRALTCNEASVRVRNFLQRIAIGFDDRGRLVTAERMSKGEIWRVESIMCTRVVVSFQSPRYVTI